MEPAPLPKVNRRGGKGGGQSGALSCQPVRRIVARDRFYASPHSVVFLTICEHAPTSEHRKPGMCLHMYNRTIGKKDLSASTALTGKQLDLFIEMLQQIRKEMLTHASTPITKDLPSA